MVVGILLSHHIKINNNTKVYNVIIITCVIICFLYDDIMTTILYLEKTLYNINNNILLS